VAAHAHDLGENVRDFEVRIPRIDTQWERTFSYNGSITLELGREQLAFVSITDITQGS
jgi:hypothetical protein